METDPWVGSTVPRVLTSTRETLGPPQHHENLKIKNMVYSVAQACNPGFQEKRQMNQKFKASFGCTVKSRRALVRPFSKYKVRLGAGDIAQR